MAGGGKGGGKQQVTDYYMTVHAGIACECDAITGIYVNDKTAWEGDVSDQTTIPINLPSLFGGNKLGGGLVGNIDWMPGRADQLVSAAYAAKLGGTPATVPGYRGFATALFYGTSHPGFLWTSNNPIIAQNLDFRVRRIPPAPALDQTLARIPAATDTGYTIDTSTPDDADQGTGSSIGAPSWVSIWRALLHGAGEAGINGYAAGLGGTAAEAAQHAANSINASSQFFTATASGTTVTVTERGGGNNQWVNAVQPVADPDYPYKASVGNSTSGFEYFFGISAFGAPSGSGGAGVPSGPAPGVATLSLYRVPETGMSFSLGPEVFTFTSYPGDDANPAFMIYDVLTNTDWGMGYPASSLDTAAFNYAASVLFGESLGLSTAWSAQSSIEDFVNEILNHIQGVVYLNPENGLLTLKLLRGDYDVLTLPTYGPDQIVMTDYQKKQWAETINEVVVSWTNPVTEQIETVTAQNPSNIAIQGGEIVSDPRNYYMVRNEVLAAKLAARECRMASAPLDSCEIEIDRSAWATRPGDCIIINYPENQVFNGVFRVGKVAYGTLENPKIKVTLLRDIFSLTIPTITTAGGTRWQGSQTPPGDFTAFDIFTLPYYFQTNTNLQSSILNLQYPEVLAGVLAWNDNADYTSFDLWAPTTLSNGDSTWASFGTKTLVLNVASPALVAETTTQLSVSLFGTTARAPQIGGFLLIGTGDTSQEIVQIAVNDGTYFTLNRGMLDTVPQDWPAGTPMWVLNPGLINTDGGNIWSAGETVNYKLLSRTSMGTLDLADATEHSATMTARPWLPLRPANVKVNGTGFGSVAIGSSTDIAITWETRNRTLEDGTAVPWAGGAIAPEYYQETIVTVYDQTGAQVYQQTGLWTETGLTLPASDFARYTSIKIVVSSRLNGDLDSLMGHAITVTGLPGNGSAALPPAPPAPPAPPSPIAAPNLSHWTLGTTSVVDASGNSSPAITITGTPESLSDEDLVVRYRVHGTSNWVANPLIPLGGGDVHSMITGVAGDTSYDVEFAYQAAYGDNGNILSEWVTPANSPITTPAAVNVQNIFGYLTAPAMTLLADGAGNVASFSGVGGQFKVFHGVTDVTSDATFGLDSEAGLTAAIDSSGAYSVSAMSANTASATFTATYNGVEILLSFSLTKIPFATNSLTLQVDNPSITIRSYWDGTVVNFNGATGAVRAYYGNADVTGAATLSAAADGVGGQFNTVANSPVNGKPAGYFEIDSMSADTGTLTISVTYEGQTLTQVISVSKLKSGLETITGPSLPTDDLFEDRTVVFQGSVYTYTNGAWSNKVAPSQLTASLGSINPDPTFLDFNYWTVNGIAITNNGGRPAFVEDFEFSGHLAAMGVSRLLAWRNDNDFANNYYTVRGAPMPMQGDGRSVTIRFKFYNPQHCSFQVGLQFYDASGTSLGTVVKTVPAATGIASYSAQGLIPANTDSCRFVMFNNKDGAGGGDWSLLSGLQAFFSITTDMVKTGSLEADVLLANSITSAQLATTELISVSGQIGDLIVDTIHIKNGALSNSTTATTSTVHYINSSGTDLCSVTVTPSSSSSTFLIGILVRCYPQSSGQPIILNVSNIPALENMYIYPPASIVVDQASSFIGLANGISGATTFTLSAEMYSTYTGTVTSAQIFALELKK